MEKILQEKLNIYNETVENKYRERWGSTLAFLEATHQLGGESVDEVAVFTRINMHQEELKAKKKQAGIEKEQRDFVKKYGVTRAHVPDGRPVPKNYKDEKQYAPLDKNIIIAQHGLRKQTDDQMRNIAKIEDLKNRLIVDQAQINVIQTRMRSKEVNTRFRMHMPNKVPRGQNLLARSDLRQGVSADRGASRTSSAQRMESGMNKGIGWSSDRQQPQFLQNDYSQTQKNPGINFGSSLDPSKTENQSDDLYGPNKTINQRHQRNFTLVNGNQHMKLFNEESRNDKMIYQLDGQRYSQEANPKITISESAEAGDNNYNKTAYTTQFRSGQPISPQNLQNFNLNYGLDGPTAQNLLSEPKTSIDKGFIQIQQSTLQTQQTHSDEVIQHFSPYTMADKIQAQAQDGQDNTSGRTKLENYKQSNEISVAKRLMMQKLGGRASTSEGGFRNKYRASQRTSNQYRSGALHSSQSNNRSAAITKDRFKSASQSAQNAIDDFNQKAQTQYVNINHRKEIHLNYAANNAKSKKNTRGNHVFNLQCTSRLAHKFAGSTTLQGKKEHQNRMIVEPGKHGTFEEQEQHVKGLVDKSKSKVTEFIHSETSVKQNNVRCLINAIISGEGEKVGINPEKYRFAMNMDKDGGNSDLIGKQQADKSQQGAADISSIGAHNKLQIAIIKHSEFVKQKVSDDFSKAKDPIDQYNEINELADIIRRQDQADINKKKKQEMAELRAQGKADEPTKEQLMQQWYDTRKVHQRTPRRFNEVKGEGDAELFYDPYKKNQNIPEIQMNKDILQKRQYQIQAIEELNTKKENEDHAKLKIHKMPLELRLILDVDPDEQNRIYRLMGLTSLLFLKMNDIRAFMKKRKFNSERMEVMVKNVKFSKEFFNIMDDDGAGGICLEELAQPLIALGLATDTGFVQKSLKALNPSKFGPGKFDEAELTIKEFSRIFRTDSVSEKLIKQIQIELAEQDRLKLLEEQKNEQIQRLKELRDQRKEQEHLECLCQHYQMQPDGNAGLGKQGTANMFDQSLMNQQQFSMVSGYEDQMNAGPVVQQQRQSQLDASQMDIRLRQGSQDLDYNWDEDQFEKTRQGFDPQALMMQQEQQNMNILQQLIRQKAIDEEISRKKILEAHKKEQKEKFKDRHKQYLFERGQINKNEMGEESSNKKVHDINDQVQIVQMWWEQLQQEDLLDQREKGFVNATIKQRVPLQSVVKKFVQWKIFQDQTSARRYLLEHDADYDDVEDEKDYFEFNDFLAIFLKGIFKDVVCGIANTAQNFRRKDQMNVPLKEIQQRSLLWKLSDYKRENLFDLLAKGQIKRKDEEQKIVQRPIFSNLYNLKYRTDPDKWKNIKYEDFLEETIKKQPEIEDPYEVPLDAYELALNFISQDFSKEIEQFEKIQSYNVKPKLKNLNELEKFFEDLVQKKLDLRKLVKEDMSEKEETESTVSKEPSVVKQKSASTIQPSIYEEEQSKIDVYEIMYGDDKKKDRFELNNEKKEFVVERKECPTNLVDVLSKQDRLDQQKKLVQDQTIEKHHSNLRRLTLYNKPEYQSDPYFEQKFEQMIQMGIEDIDKIKLSQAELAMMEAQARKEKEKAVESVSEQSSHESTSTTASSKNKLFKIIKNVRKMNKDKYELLKKCHQNLQGIKNDGSDSD